VVEPRRITFDRPDRFVPGSTGEPGARAFFVQIRDGSMLATLEVGETLLRGLARHLTTVLREIEPPAAGEHEVEVDIAPLDLPLFPLFDVGATSVAWDRHADVVRVELVESASEPVVVEVTLPLRMARRFIARAGLVTQTAAPACPFCAQTVSAAGHLCPRRDGLRTLTR